MLLSCQSESPSDKPEKERNPGRQLEYTGTVTFLNSNNEEISTVDVAVADTRDTRQTGLMNVYSMPEDKGMIFIFERQENLRFWMANTPISLDIIFVNDAMQIVRIHRNVRPYSTDGVESGEPALYTVEVNAGYTMKHDIQEGMSIAFSRDTL